MKNIVKTLIILLVFSGVFLAGSGKFVLDDQKCSSGTIKAIQNGVVKAFYDDGKLKEEWTFKDNKRNGPAKMYYRNGQVYWEVNYINGKIDGMERTYYESGKKEQENMYKNGKYDGLCTKYFEDGTVDRDTIYRDGKMSPYYPQIIIWMSALIIWLAGIILFMKLKAKREVFVWYLIICSNLPVVLSRLYEYKRYRDSFSYVQIGLFVLILICGGIIIIKSFKKEKALKK
ncbi:MAG: hypothetical protein NTX32_05450 [Candidatus Firestonebacteria bacterium]|nr:hypothetical protein [Candidatus Firestonebacteria bacterium]